MQGFLSPGARVEVFWYQCLRFSLFVSGFSVQGFLCSGFKV